MWVQRGLLERASAKPSKDANKAQCRGPDGPGLSGCWGHYGVLQAVGKGMRVGAAGRGHRSGEVTLGSGENPRKSTA